LPPGSPLSQSALKRHLRRLDRRARRLAGGTLRALRGDSSVLLQAIRPAPLLIADKTYNTSHVDYEPELARNYPNRMSNPDLPCTNPIFIELKKRANGDVVPESTWHEVRAEVMEEARTVAGFEQIMERKASIEQYLAEQSRRYGAHYVAGWVNLVDAQFLYWAVRRARPKVIVQTGVCNGLSSAFIMLALAKNGPDGQLYVIDLPRVLNPRDPAWTVRGKVYGEVICEGKSSGWIVPEIYHDRFHVDAGDAKVLLPPLVDRLENIDMFFHDSDHSYAHMMFEFEEVVRKLVPDATVLADDIGWNTSLWDFADKYKLPGYNYLGTVGLAFLRGKA
jgi:predicted O-methyltransferase YrrM